MAQWQGDEDDWENVVTVVFDVGKIPSERFNETQFYFCSVPDCYAEYVVIVILNKAL